MTVRVRARERARESETRGVKVEFHTVTRARSCSRSGVTINCFSLENLKTRGEIPKERPKMAASEGQQPVPPFLPVAPESRELDQISIMIPDNIVPNPRPKCLPTSGARAAHLHVLALRAIVLHDGARERDRLSSSGASSRSTGSMWRWSQPTIARRLGWAPPCGTTSLLKTTSVPLPVARPHGRRPLRGRRRGGARHRSLPPLVEVERKEYSRATVLERHATPSTLL